MADTYRDFETLDRHEEAGVDYRILVRRASDAYAIIALHGGGIEEGTSELGDAVADESLSFYGFEGLKTTGNAVLHITATRFDEPMCLALIARVAVVITLHGEHSDGEGEAVFLGGRDDGLGERIGRALRLRGFDVRRHSDPDLQGLDPKNICNRGTSGRGVQLELPRAVRRTMFRSLSREGRRHPTQLFRDFVDALHAVLEADDVVDVACDSPS